MTPLKRKWVHAGLVALVSVLADIGSQLQAGTFDNATRAVLLGLIVGGMARVIGAVLASLAFPPDSEEG